MHLLVVTDIFGKTSHLEELVATFSYLFDSIEYLAPYGGDEIDFINEQQAYSHFMKTLGLPGYITELQKRLAVNKRDALYLLGFSAGASAIWAVSEMTGLGITGATCFYSSQIRKYLHVKPRFEIELFFAKTEPSYSVDEVMELLSGTGGVTCHKTGYGHGFMNNKSVNFNEKAYQHCGLLLKSRFEYLLSLHCKGTGRI